MVSRKNGKILINTLDLECFMATMFLPCKSEHEVAFIQDNIISAVEAMAQDTLYELKKGDLIC